jgi:hypothetical protein
MEGPDLNLPLWVSDLILTARSRSNCQTKKAEGLTVGTSTARSWRLCCRRRGSSGDPWRLWSAGRGSARGGRGDGETTISNPSCNGDGRRLELGSESGCPGRGRARRFHGGLGDGDLTMRWTSARRVQWRYRRGVGALSLRQFLAEVLAADSEIRSRTDGSI